MKTYQDLKEHTLGMIAFFETSNTYPECYGITSGNWDGAGVSHGVLQYNFGTGSLQTLWNHLNNNYNQLCRDIFGADYQEWSDMINATLSTQQAWGTEIGDPATGRHSVLPPWNTYFMNLGTSQPSIDKQIEMSGSWHTNALKWFNNLGLYSRRGYALMFDISVQMGRFFPQNVCLERFRQIDPTGKTRAQIEEEKLHIIVELASNGNNRCFPTQSLPTLPQIVFDRKNAVVVGSSVQGFDITDYDLQYDPAFKGGLFSGIGLAGKPIVEPTELYNAIRLDWEHTENTTSYKIYRATNIENLGITLQETTDNTFTDNTAVGGTTYYYTVKAINELDTTNSDKITAIPSSILTYENKTVDFTGYTAWTVYGDAQAISDFGNINQTVQGGDNLKIDTSERLRFQLPAGMVGSANTGGIIKAGIVPKNEYNLEYGLRFDSGFPWSKGGKIPGLSGGVGYTGGTPAWAGDGFSVRMMWRENGKIIPYVYHKNQPDEFGDHFGLSSEGIGYFTDTKEYIIKYYVKLNTGSDENGILRIWLDDVQILNKTNLVYRTDTSKIDTCHIAIFAGGSTEDWNMTGLGYMRLSYIKWE